MTDTIPTVIEVDCTSGISTERPMTADEVANMEAMRADQEARAAEADAKAAADAIAKDALLVKLGISAEEAKLLLS